jgi:hypothetical protein
MDFATFTRYVSFHQNLITWDRDAYCQFLF